MTRLLAERLAARSLKVLFKYVSGHRGSAWPSRAPSLERAINPDSDQMRLSATEPAPINPIRTLPDFCPWPNRLARYPGVSGDKSGNSYSIPFSSSLLLNDLHSGNERVCPSQNSHGLPHCKELSR